MGGVEGGLILEGSAYVKFRSIGGVLIRKGQRELAIQPIKHMRL